METKKRVMHYNKWKEENATTVKKIEDKYQKELNEIVLCFNNIHDDMRKKLLELNEPSLEIKKEAVNWYVGYSDTALPIVQEWDNSTMEFSKKFEDIVRKINNEIQEAYHHYCHVIEKPTTVKQLIIRLKKLPANMEVVINESGSDSYANNFELKSLSVKEVCEMPNGSASKYVFNTYKTGCSKKVLALFVN